MVAPPITRHLVLVNQPGYREMAGQFARPAEVHPVPGAHLFVHEERPEEVAAEVIRFAASCCP